MYTKMEQPDAISTITFNDSSTNISEMLPERNNIVASSSATNKTKRNKLAIVKPANQRNGFPLKSHISRNESDIPQDDAQKSYENHPDLQKHTVPTFFSHFKTRRPASQRQTTTAEKRLKDIIHDLDENPAEDEAFVEQKTSATGCSKRIRQSRKFLVHIMEQPNFHYTIIVLIMLDLIIVFVDLIIGQLSLACFSDEEMKLYNTTEQRDDCLLPPSDQLENGETALYYISIALVSIFVLEILTAFYAFGWRRYTKLLFLFDAFIVFASFVLEVYFHFGSVGKAGKASAGIVILRMWKIIRAIHAVAHAVTLRNHIIIEEIEKAREIVHEEKLQAEETISEQRDQINYLTDLLNKSNKQGDSNRNISFVRNRTQSLGSITRF